MFARILRHHLLGSFVEANLGKHSDRRGGGTLLQPPGPSDDDLHHADGLGQRAHEVIVREAVLLQEILHERQQLTCLSPYLDAAAADLLLIWHLADDLCNFQGTFLIFGKGILSDQPGDQAWTRHG